MRTLLALLFCGMFGTAAAQPALEQYHLAPDKYVRAVELHHRLYALHFGGVAWDLIVLSGMLLLRAGPRMESWTNSRIHRPVAARLAGIAVLLAISWLAHQPLAIYRHMLGLEYGISVQPWPSWLWDLAKQAAVEGAIAVTLAAATLWLLARRYGWVQAWVLCLAAVIAGTYAEPLLFDPLFFRFQPLDQSHPDIATALRNVAQRAGFDIPVSRIFEMDASRKTREMNAYLTGFGDSRRIVVWDTTIAALTPPQVQTVFAHELGHEALGHIPRTILLAAAGLLAIFWLAARLFSQRAGVAALPAILMFIVITRFLVEPLVNGYSRWQEQQADVYELDLMHQLIPDAGINSARVDQIMGEADLDDPQPAPWIQIWLYDHPPTPARMIFAQRYQPRARR